MTAANDAKLRGQSDAPGYAGAIYNGFVNGETVSDLSGTLSIVRSNTDEAVGTYSDVMRSSGLTATNYDITFDGGDFTIVGSDTLLLRSTQAGTQVYGSAPTYGFTTAQYLDVNDQLIDLTSSVSSVGSVVVVNEGSGANQASAAFVISAVEGQASSSGSLSVGGYNVQAGALTPIVGTMSFSSAMVSGSLQVTPKTVATPSDADLGQTTKTYDGSTSVAGLDLSNALQDIESGDVVAMSGAGYFDDRHVGTGKAVTVGLALQGTDARNYMLPSTTLTNNDGEITPLASVAFIGANGAVWSEAPSWANGAIPDRKPGTTVDNVLQVNIDSGKTVVYDADIVGQTGSILQNNGRINLRAATDFELGNSLTGSGVFGQVGQGILTVAGSSAGFNGSLDIGSGRVVIGSVNALGATPTITSNGGTLAIARDVNGDPLVLNSISVTGPINLGALGGATTGSIYTTNDQTYNGALTFLSTGSAGVPNADPTLAVAAVPNFSATNGNIRFDGTVSAGLGSKGAERSLIVEAANGTVTFNDQVGMNLIASRVPFFTKNWSSYAGNQDHNPYTLEVTANRIELFADVTTFETQTYNGAVWIGNNRSNGNIRLLVSLDPAITFTGTVDDVDGSHTLVAKAISIDASENPTLDFQGDVGGQTALAGFIAEVGIQDQRPGELARVADIDSSVAAREDPSRFNGTVSVGGNVTTTGDQRYVARLVDFGATTLDIGGELAVITGLPAPGQPIDQAQVASFTNLTNKVILRGEKASISQETRINPSFVVSGINRSVRRILPPSLEAAVSRNLVGGAINQRITTSMTQTGRFAGGGRTIAGADVSGQSILMVSAEVDVGEIDVIDCATGPVSGALICGSE